MMQPGVVITMMVTVLVWASLLSPAIVAQTSGAVQSAAVIRGQVTDSATSEALIGASVFFKGTSIGTKTDSRGNFELKNQFTRRGVLRVQYVGYVPQQVMIDSSTTYVTFRLRADTIQIGLITIEADASEKRFSTFTLSPQGIKNVPPLGEPDIIRTLSLLPGINQTNDFKSDFSVRGGGFDQNQFLIDDVEIYNPNHLVGVFGAFNVNALQEATLYAGHFPAEYGGRLSSVLSMKTRTPTDSLFLTANVSLLSASATLAVILTDTHPSKKLFRILQLSLTFFNKFRML
jgi:ferric enterobactin receptor